MAQGADARRPPARMTEIRSWGRTDYPAALERMRALRAARRRGEVPDTLVLTEHPPVITVGVQGLEGETPPSGCPVVSVERGGHATYHAPGQLVGYAIVDLEPRGRDVRRFVHDLEELVGRALRPLGIEADRRPGQRGVWVGEARKIASVGVAVQEWVTFHGFALNVDLDLAPFTRFRPCGLDGRLMTSVARELGRPVGLGELVGPVSEAWRTTFPAGAGPIAAPPVARLGA